MRRKNIVLCYMTLCSQKLKSVSKEPIASILRFHIQQNHQRSLKMEAVEYYGKLMFVTRFLETIHTFQPHYTTSHTSTLIVTAEMISHNMTCV
jgi:uncharacterized lipoprotein YbaY